MSWDYAELSKSAKAAGGPEKLVEMIEQTSKAIGRSEGKASMAPWILFAGIAAYAATATVMKVSEYIIKEKKRISQKAVDQAKEELIQGIKEYDATHPDTVDSESYDNVKKADDTICEV